MTEPHEQTDLAAGRLTDEEVAAFGQALAAFRDSLPPRQRDALSAILALAAEAGGDVQGHAAARPPLLQHHFYVEVPGILLGSFRGEQR